MGSCPRGSVSRQFAGAIRDGGNRHVRELPRQHAHEIDDLSLDRPTGLPDLVLPDRHLGVVATLPMNDERQSVARQSG